ncbi:DNA replication protein DnaC [Butyrivibrio sp. INlla18]|uniref:ATP-binding protein n=1 Tax=Butyrivibrio sp. INlla18 TaxID=1520806 RepID=UPI00088E77C5|nr:ATP-binding protein [Butyrivibrio sp. INlla18]SDA79071.1 DNA replication protein DnaC [Butyrivibrio sp. INlla18]
MELLTGQTETEQTGKALAQENPPAGLKMRSTSTASECPICRGTGWAFYDENGYSYARECDCGIRKREALGKKLKFANIPDAFSDVRMENFRHDIYRRQDSQMVITKDCKAINWWIDGIEKMKAQGMGLYLYSDTKGSGKTRMAASIANDLIYRCGLSVKFATSVQILNEIRASWNREEGMTEHQLLDDLSKAEILVIDDFGIERIKDWIEEKLYHIINSRYINRLITIYTSNLPIERLEYDDRITNRIKERSFPLMFPAESVRDYIAEDNFACLKAVMAS